MLSPFHLQMKNWSAETRFAEAPIYHCAPLFYITHVTHKIQISVWNGTEISSHPVQSNCKTPTRNMLTRNMLKHNCNSNPHCTGSYYKNYPRLLGSAQPERFCRSPGIPYYNMSHDCFLEHYPANHYSSSKIFMRQLCFLLQDETLLLKRSALSIFSLLFLYAGQFSIPPYKHR